MPARVSDTLNLGTLGDKYFVSGIASASAAISVICSISAIEIECSRPTPVQDVIAPPKPKSHVLFAPRLVSAKRSRCRRKSGGGDEGHYDAGADGGGNFGNGSGDDNSGGGGWDDWKYGWNDDERESRNRFMRGGTFSLLYQLACWISLSQCLKHAFDVTKSKEHASNEPNPFLTYPSSCNHGLDLFPLSIPNQA